MNTHELKVLFKVSFVIALIIYVTAFLSDFAIKSAYASNNPLIQIGIGLLAIMVITFVIMFLFWWVPDVRKAVQRMFGIENEAPASTR